ncbi:MAG: hypothetical protein HRT99_01995 [Mycoplasmatales bacterium]|nr:hypothetical protein [Mycoplasmatales bacterium]
MKKYINKSIIIGIMATPIFFTMGCSTSSQENIKIATGKEKLIKVNDTDGNKSLVPYKFVTYENVKVGDEFKASWQNIEKNTSWIDTFKIKSINDSNGIYVLNREYISDELNQVKYENIEIGFTQINAGSGDFIFMNKNGSYQYINKINFEKNNYLLDIVNSLNLITNEKINEWLKATNYMVESLGISKNGKSISFMTIQKTPK